jgi:hypothetical protein
LDRSRQLWSTQLANEAGNVQLIVVVVVQVVPALGVTDINDNPVEAKVSVRVVPFAADGPLFVTVML